MSVTTPGLSSVQSNPMGVGLQGPYDNPDFTVPRVRPGGQVVRRTNQDRADAASLMGLRGGVSSPLELFDQIIRREDFPPGLDGQKQYEAALAAIGAAPGPLDVTGRSLQEQAVFQASQAAMRSDQGGSSALAVQSWAQNHPDLAFQALMALTNGTISDPTLLMEMDDAVIRDIVVALGGVGAVQQRMEQERQRLIDQGVIPDNTFAASTGEPWTALEPNPVQRTPGAPPGVTPPSTPPGTVPTNYTGPGSAFVPDEVNYYLAPVDPVIGEAYMGQTGPQVATPESNPELYPPYQMQYNGEVVGVTPLPDMFMYTMVGNDTYLDVTNPQGYVERYTGDVVEAAYSTLGYTSFDQMVAELGYEAAYQVLRSFITPSAQTTPGAGAGGLGGGIQPTTPPGNYFPEPTGPPTNQPTNY